MNVKRNPGNLVNLVHPALVSIACLLWLSSAYAAPNPPLNLDGWVTEALAKLETDGVTGGFHRHTAPLSRAEVIEILHQAEARVRAGVVVPSEIDRKLLEKLKREFSVFREAFNVYDLRNNVSLRNPSSTLSMTTLIFPELRATTEKIAPALEGAFHYQHGHLTLYTECEAHNFEEPYRPDNFLYPPAAKGKSAEQRLERWRGGYTGNVKRGYVQINAGQFNVLMGRDAIFWGASPQTSVGISDNSPPFDQVRLTGTFGKFKATAFTTQLDATWNDENVRYLAKRYLSGHRLDYQHNDRLEIGIAEWVLYGGDAQTLDFKYANPVTFYYALQYNAKSDDNVMFAFDIAIRPFDGVRLYGEWLIDDFQYVPGARDPHAVAWLCGVEWYPKRLARQFGIRAEYARVNRWAYTHLVPDNQFTHFGAMIGHPIGNDADTFTMRTSYQFTVSTKAEFAARVSRNGEGTVAARFYGEDFNALPFPTGVVEHITAFGGTVTYRPRRAWNARFTYAWQHTRNYQHSVGESGQGHRAFLQLGYLW